MTQLQKAIALAVATHQGQVDKGGQPYILHPIRVMTRVQARGLSEDHQVVAVLHDVIEDTGTTIADLIREDYSRSAISALEAITRLPGEQHDFYLERVMANKIALEVKIADLEDNMEPFRKHAQQESMNKRYAATLLKLLREYYRGGATA